MWFSIITAFKTNPNTVTNLSKLYQLHLLNAFVFFIHFLGETNLTPYRMLRIDGSTPVPIRMKNIRTFNAKPSVVDVLLVSTRSGGEGINLTAGTRLVMFDVCWNPSHDQQAMVRSKSKS